jgi:hypothetical protein
LVDYPVQRGAGPETVFEGLWRDAGECGGFVHFEGLAVLAQLHLSDALGVRDVLVLDDFQRPWVERFVVDVQVRQFSSGGGERIEIGSEGNARQFALKVGGVTLAVAGAVEDGVEVVEDVFPSDAVVEVVLAELVERTYSPPLYGSCPSFFLALPPNLLFDHAISLSQ